MTGALVENLGCHHLEEIALMRLISVIHLDEFPALVPAKFRILIAGLNVDKAGICQPISFADVIARPK
jgi:hypothetical protein